MLARASLRCVVLARLVQLIVGSFLGSVLRMEGVAVTRRRLIQRGGVRS